MGKGREKDEENGGAYHKIGGGLVKIRKQRCNFNGKLVLMVDCPRIGGERETELEKEATFQHPLTGEIVPLMNLLSYSHPTKINPLLYLSFFNFM